MTNSLEDASLITRSCFSFSLFSLLFDRDEANLHATLSVGLSVCLSVFFFGLLKVAWCNVHTLFFFL